MQKNYILFLLIGLLVFSTNAQVTLSQSNDNSTVEALGITCWISSTTAYEDNSYFRAYNLVDFGITDGFDITSVEYAQWTADAGKEITCNIYTATSDDLSVATLSLVGTGTHVSSITDDGTMISVSLSASIPANSTIAFEVFAAGDGVTLNEKFFIGINSSGENDDSYLMAPACSVFVPTITGDIGAQFADHDFVMNVKGNVLSIDEFSIDNSIAVYPNPTSDIITLDVSNAISIKNIELYNIIGKQVLKTNNTSVLDLTNLEPGVYLLKVSTEQGSITKKVIRN